MSLELFAQRADFGTGLICVSITVGVFILALIIPALSTTGRRLQFGLSELLISVALVAATIVCWKCLVWTIDFGVWVTADDPPIPIVLLLLAFMLASAGVGCCAFAAVGVLFRCGNKAAICGTVLGVAFAALVIGLLFLGPG